MTEDTRSRHWWPPRNQLVHGVCAGLVAIAGMALIGSVMRLVGGWPGTLVGLFCLGISASVVVRRERKRSRSIDHQ